MKSDCLRFTVRLLATTTCVVLAGCQSVSEAPAVLTGARIIAVQGRARCSDASHPWRKLGVGDTVTTGQLLQTAVTSSVDLAAAANGVEAVRVLLQADTVVFVEGLPGESAPGGTAGDATLKLHLRQGGLTFTSPASGQGPACEIRTATGLAGARGATFQLQSDGHVKVFRATVTLKSSGDKPARTVAAGNQYNPSTGELTPIPAGESTTPVTSPPAGHPPQLPQWPPWPTRKF